MIDYWRLHGSPTVCRSSYMNRIDLHAEALLDRRAAAECWCIFANTASSAGAGDALPLASAVRARDEA